MAAFDPKQVSVLISGYEVTDWADGGDVIDCKHNADAGSMTMGANGTGVFIANPDQSVTLTLKIKQHSPDNRYLDKLKEQQVGNIKTFSPLTLEIKDLLNEDIATATRGFFTTRPAFTRGTSHNAEVWVIVFEKGNIKLEKGWGN